MFKQKKFNLVMTILMVASVFLAACSSQSTSGESGSGSDGDSEASSESKKTKVFTMARSSDADLIDPGFAWAEGDIDIVFHIFDGLVKFKNDKLEVEPALAKEWNRSEDGKTWTFDLRKDVTFHDGSDFTSEDVVNSFKRVTDKESKYYGQVEGGYSYLNYLMGDVIKDVKADGDYTVKFELNQKFAPFLTYMGYYSQYIVSTAALEKYGSEFPKNPVGTGPFKFEEWKKGEYVKLTANENYWGEKPKIETLVFKVVPESSTRLMELQTGQVDVIKSVDPGQIKKIKENKDLELVSVPGANLFYGSINTTKEPFNNKKVRQALNYAIDTKSIIDGIYEGNGTRAINALPPTVFSFDKSAGPYEYNPEKAKELLKEAGYPNGFDMKLNTFQYARTYVAKPVQVAEVIKSNFKDVGINVEIKVNEWATHSAILDKMDHDIGLTGWYDIPYPSNFLKTMALEGGSTGFKPDELVELSKKAWNTYDREEQKKHYQELQQKLHEQAPLIPIAHRNYTAALRKDVKGFELDVVGTIRAHKAYKE